MEIRKILSAVSAVILLVFFAGCSNGDPASDFEYEGSTITKYIGSKSDVKIPSEIEGKSVTKICNNAFRGCTELNSVTIPNGVIIIEDSAFNGCINLSNVTIPNGVKTIGGQAFKDCAGLKIITIPDGVEVIGPEAFNGCTGLTSVTIPSSVTEIGYRVFCGCPELTEINVDNNNQIFSSEDGVLYKSFETHLILIQCPAKKQGSFTIPNDVIYISERAFNGCEGLTSVTIPDSVFTIESGAFFGCTGLTCITIPDSVTRIGSGAFIDCTATITYKGKTYSSDEYDALYKAINGN